MKTDRRFSRRILVTGTAGLAAGTFGAGGVAAHGGGYAALRPGSRGAPTLLRYALQAANIPTPREQTLVISQSIVNIWDSFNPYIPNGESYQYGVNQTSREHLFYANFEQGEIINWLATGYEYNADFTQLTLKLNPAAAWSDGQPFTADDLLFTFDLLKNNANFVGSDPVRNYVASATAADPQTVVISLDPANPRFHYNFIVGIVNAPIRIVPKHVWESVDAGTFTNNPPVYTGPYVLDRALPDQFMQVWRKNPNYWNKANLDPKPEYVIYRQYLPADAEAEEFARGSVDIPSLPYLNQQAVKDRFTNWIAFNFNDPCPRGIWMNQDSPSGLFQSAEGRWAISNLLDREKIATSIWQPTTAPAEYPWAAWGMHDRWTNQDIKDQYPFTFDPAKAEQLLDGIGATKSGDKRQLNGQNLALTMITPTQVGDSEYEIARLLAQEAEKVGIDIEVKSLPGSAMWDAYRSGDYDLTSHWLCGVALDPNELYTKFLIRDYKPIGEQAVDNRNETRTRIPEFNDIAEQLEKVNPDDPENKPLFDQGLDSYTKNLPAMESGYTLYPFAISQEYWTG